MKKLLNILAVAALTATTASSLVACTPTNYRGDDDYDSKVGLGIDRSEAIQDSNLDEMSDTNLGFTNFYTLGDSLSDYNGLSTVFTELLTKVINFVDIIDGDPKYEKMILNLLNQVLGPDGITIEVSIAKITITADNVWNGSILTGFLANMFDLVWNMISGSLPLPTELLTILKPYIKTLLTQGLKFMIHELAVDFDKIEFNFQTNVQDENGSKPSDLQISNGMTNGKPAAVLFAEKLGMSVDSEETSKKQFNGAVNTNILGLFDVKLDTPGNNYAIGGATSANVNRMEGLLLNSVKIQDQAIALLKDHVTKPTDLVFLEIGGNDLFNMCRLFDTSNPTASEKGIEELMTQAMDNIKTTLLTLLNNNVKNIIIANAPDISLIPSYVVNENSSEDKKIMANKAHELSLEFNKRFNNIFEQLNTKYGNTMKMFDMANKFSEMLTEFKKGEDGVEGTSDDGIIDKASVDLGSGMKFEKDETNKSLNITIYNELKKSSGTYIDPNKYFFWDTIHPNHWAHENVANNELLKLAIEMSKTLGLS